MQLRTARLCHDCEEIHEGQRCPVCASETFSFIMRWVPAPERRARPRPETSEKAEVYQQLISPESRPSTRRPLMTRAVVGLTALSVAGWLWRRSAPRPASVQDGADEPDR